MNCNGCGKEGVEGPVLLSGDDPFDKIKDYEDVEGPLLFEMNGGHYCFLCKCKLDSACFQCSEDVDALYRDKRCKSQSYVCKDCLANDRINHTWTCYANGCMTPGELAQDEYEMALENGEI